MKERWGPRASKLTLIVDDGILRGADELYEYIGLDVPTAVSAFLIAACEPRTAASGAVELPAERDDPEDDVHDALCS